MPAIAAKRPMPNFNPMGQRPTGVTMPGARRNATGIDSVVSTSGGGTISAADAAQRATADQERAARPMPGTMQDPNSGNLFQWRPDLPQGGTNAGWSLFSTGDNAPRGQAGRAAGGFDALGQMSRIKSMLPRSVPRVAAPDPAARAAAESAAFSRAKDRIGLATQGLLKSVGSEYESRGIGGSSLEGDAIEGALGQGGGAINDVIREQAIQGLMRDFDVEDRNYAGDISQRGQDISQRAQKTDAMTSLLRLIQSSGGAY